MMTKNIISIVLGFGLLAMVTATLAVPFNSFDPKSMAMGGAGVAVPSSGSAPFFNPALLSIADEGDDFALELPILGGHFADSDDFIDALDNFDDTLMNNLDTAISNYNATPGNSSSVINAVNNLNSGITALGNKPVQFDINAGLVIGIPSDKYGLALTVSGGANLAGIFNYEDGATVSNLTDDMAELDICYALPVVDQPACLSAPATFNYVDTDPLSPTFGQVEFTAQSDTNLDSDIQSKAHFVGVIIVEVGLSFSREFSVLGSDWAIGLTPKSISVTVIDYEANADSSDTDNIDGDNYTTDYEDFNIDVGIARNYDNGWRMGFVVKNLIPSDYQAFNTDPVTGLKTATSTIIQLKPQARVGISHSNSWSMVAVDLDLTKNESLGNLNEKSQYLAMGVEFDAFDSAQFRLGYRADLVDNDRNIASIGFGLSPFGVHIDLAVAGNSDEAGASFQLGFRF